MSKKSKAIRALVSGSTGQLGQELMAMCKAYPRIKCDFKNRAKLDLSSKASIYDNLEESSYDFYINCAAYTAVDQAESNAKMAYKVNAEALKYVAEAAPPTCKIIHISSDYVYHTNPGRPLRETDKTNPQGVYAKSKLDGEENLLKSRPDSLVIRTSWVYSSYGNNFVKTMLRLGKDRKALNIVSDQLGTPTYAKDLAVSILEMINNYSRDNFNQTPKAGIYNYSNLGLTDWASFAKEIFKQAKIKCKVGPTTTKAYGAPAPRPLWSMMSKEKIQSDFQLKIPTWKESLASCLKELGHKQ